MHDATVIKHARAPTFSFLLFHLRLANCRMKFFVISEVGMEKDDAIVIMSKLASKLDDVLVMEELVSAFAEFLAHIKPSVSEQDFAFLATVGAMIYRKGGRHYDSSLETDLLMARLRAIPAD